MATTNAMDGAISSVAEGGTGLATLTANNVILGNGTSNVAFVAPSTSGNLLTSNGTTWTSAAASSSSATGPGFATNNYYSGIPVGYDGATNTAVSANRLYFYPFPINSIGAFTRIGVRVTTLHASNARLGIYNMVNGLPTTLVQDCGTVSVGTTGNKEITITQTLNPGSYALASVFSGTPTMAFGVNMYANNSTGGAFEFFGGTDATFASAGYGTYSAFTYGALPSPFAGALTYLATCPFMWMRVV